MKNLRILFFAVAVMALFTTLSFGYTRVVEAANTTDGQQALLQQYRFQKHAGQDFERLVLQFDDVKAVKGRKVSTSFPLDGGNTTIVEVTNLSVNKNIPVNFMDTFKNKKSKYLTSVNFNINEGNAFATKLGLDSSDTVVDAFWLENPSRLVIDVFPKNSPRSAGPAILGQAAEKADRTAASDPLATEAENLALTVKEEIKKVMTKTRDTWNSNSKYRKDFYCFPASAEVTASLDYKTKATEKVAAEGTFPSPRANDYVVCYPKVATVNPRVEFFPVYPDPQVVENTAPATQANDMDLRTPTAAADVKSIENLPLMSTADAGLFLSNPNSQREE